MKTCRLSPEIAKGGLIMDNEKFQELVLEQLKTLTDGQRELKKDVIRIETRMENEVIDKTRALFDDREVQNDRLDRIENKLDDIATDVSYIAAKIAGLGKLAR